MKKVKSYKNIKEVANIYIKRMTKDLSEKAFKYHIYIEHYNIVLDFARSLKPERALNMTFNKEL